MPHRILVIRFSSLGDLILTSAAVLNLRISFPQSRIFFLTKDKLRPVVEMMSGVDEVVTIPDKMSAKRYTGLLRELNKIGFDIIVDLHGNPRSWLARKFIRAKIKTVYPKRRMERIHASRRRFKKLDYSPPHTIDLYNSAVKKAGGKIFAKRPVLGSNYNSGQNSPDEIKIDRRFVAIAPGAFYANKQWPLDRFEQVARLLRANNRIVWILTQSDRERLKEVSANDTFLIDEPINRLAPVIGKAEVLLANDSGIAHLGSAMGTPTVVIMGPTHGTLGFSPRGLFDQIVEVEESCRPCSRHGGKACFRDERYCFTRVTVAMVFEKLDALISRRKSRSGALFIDRDGTLIVEKHFLSDPNQIEFTRGAVDALKRARKLGFKIVIVSNQSGVARGKFGLDEVEKVNARLAELLQQEGVPIDGLYFCPHYPSGSVPEYSHDCDCRKPAVGMTEAAAGELEIDLRRSYVIGDKLDDYFLGAVCGARAFMVRTGYGLKESERLPEKVNTDEQTVFDDLPGVIAFLEHYGMRSGTGYEK